MNIHFCLSKETDEMPGQFLLKPILFLIIKARNSGILAQTATQYRALSTSYDVISNTQVMSLLVTPFSLPGGALLAVVNCQVVFLWS